MLHPRSFVGSSRALTAVGVLVGGPVLPIAVLLYWVSNNVWTYAHQHLVYRRIDEEDARASKPEVRVTAPKPGAKPKRRR